MPVTKPRPALLPLAILIPLLWACSAGIAAADLPDPVESSEPITLVLQPGAEGKDASVSSFETGTNFGSDIWFWGIGLPNYHVGYIQFDLSAIPANAVVTSAQISLFGEYRDGQMILTPVAAAWDEATVTWANQPAVVTPSMAVSYPISRGSPSGPCYWGCAMSFDITTIVQYWVTNPTLHHGLKIIGDTPGIGWLMASCESTSYPRPSLTVQYDVGTESRAATWGRLKALYR